MGKLIMEKNKPIKICNTLVYPGEKVTLALPTPELYTCIPMHIPIHVIHGKHSGPVLIISAAIHGDEVIGISIIQKLIKVICYSGRWCIFLCAVSLRHYLCVAFCFFSFHFFHFLFADFGVCSHQILCCVLLFPLL